LLSNPATLQDAFTNALTVDERSKPNYNIQIQKPRNDDRTGITPMELGHTQFNQRGKNKQKGKGKRN
jgi:hypothetical protein